MLVYNLFERSIKLNINNKTCRRINLIYGIVLSLLLTVTAILFILSCYRIYRSGSEPFTRASISAAFSDIAVPVYLTLIAVIGGIVISFVFPKDKQQLRGARSDRVQLDKLSSKLNYESLSDDELSAMNKERKLRRVLGYVNIVLFILSGILPLVYLLNPDNFPAVTGEYNAEILHGMLFYTVSLLPLLIYEIVYVILTDRSVSQELMIVKQAITEHGSGDGIPKTTDSTIIHMKAFLRDNSKPITLGVRIAFVGTAIVFIIIGIFNGGAAAVLQKAVKICTECIGLG